MAFPPPLQSPQVLTVTLPALSATTTLYLGKLQSAPALDVSASEFQIVGAELNIQTTVAVDGTNFWDIELKKDDGTPRTIAALTNESGAAFTWTDSEGGTQTTGNGTAWTAGTPKDFVFSTVKDDWKVDESDKLSLVFTETGTATLPAGSIIKIYYIYGHAT